MRVEDVYKGVPDNWCPMNKTEAYKLVQLPPDSEEYGQIETLVKDTDLLCIKGIYRIQNPFMFSKFKLKAHQYEQGGPVSTFKLFYDIASENKLSILKYNFDWRYGNRLNYGPGVYFYMSPALANKHRTNSNDVNGNRSMFYVDVLAQNIQIVKKQIFLPDLGYDTVVSRTNDTFVKYFDSEYYPHYMVDYVEKS